MSDSVEYIKKFLIDNPERIVELLENTNFYHVTYRRYSNQIRCSKTPDSNKNGVEVYCDTLFAVIYSTGARGDIFQIIMEHNNISFSELMKFIENFFHLEKTFYSNKKPFFGGVYAKFSKPEYEEIEDNYFEVSSDKDLLERLFNIRQDFANKLNIPVQMILSKNTLKEISGRYPSTLDKLNEYDKRFIIIGNEGNGISDKVSSLCDFGMFIPMSGKNESLNAAVAASIILWENQRQNYGK